MISDFIDVIDGVVKYNDEAWEEVKQDEEVKEEIARMGEERARRAGVILDASKDGYYTADKCVPDFIKVRILFELKNPANCGDTDCPHFHCITCYIALHVIHCIACYIALHVTYQHYM